MPTFEIHGKRWPVRMKCNIGPNKDGECDAPNVRRKAIRISRGLEPERELDTLLHETLHAAGFEILDEEWVAAVATAQAKLLTQLGWGKMP